MIEVTGNLWTYPADVRVITTNGTIKKDGTCVMGRGCAAEAKQKQKGIDIALGRLIQQNGNHCFLLKKYNSEGGIVSFPVKHNWYEKADIELIRQSCLELINITDNQGWKVIVMPRPGCGNGRLDWDYVRNEIRILDDRFHVITYD